MTPFGLTAVRKTQVIDHGQETESVTLPMSSTESIHDRWIRNAPDILSECSLATINLASTYRYPAAAAIRLPSPGFRR